MPRNVLFFLSFFVPGSNFDREEYRQITELEKIA